MHDFKKQFGQNFLTNDKFPKLVVEAADVAADDVVIEIGPGEGRLTNLLLEAGAKVIAIEIDYSLIPKLISRFGSNEDFHLENVDVMEADINAILTKYNLQSTSYKLVGSLPYNISKQIIAKFLKIEPKPEVMSLIVQEEVAQDYVAKAPKSSFISNWINLYADVRKLVSIPNTQFYPVPKVNGGILQIKPRKDVDQKQAEQMANIIRIGFTQPRKTLYNNLRNIYPGEEVTKSLAQLGLSATVRPAELASNEWLDLAKLLVK